MIRSLISYPRLMSVRAVLATIKEKIKADAEKELFMLYAAKCLRLITENAAKQVGGEYITVEYDELIKFKPADNRSAEEVINDIASELGLEVKDA